MKLADVANLRSTVRLVCRACGSFQPSYPVVMMEKHSPDTELDNALRLWPCMFCRKPGDFSVTVADPSVRAS